MTNGAHQGREGTRRGERGSAVVIAILVLTALMLLGSAFLSISLTESAISNNQISAARSFNLAEAGLEHAKKQLEGVDIADLLDGGGVLLTNRTLGQLGSYNVKIENNTGAGYGGGIVPIDGGGDEDTDGFLVITSTGMHRNAEKTLRVAVQRQSDRPYDWAMFGNFYFSAHGTGGVTGDVGTNGGMVLRTSIDGDASAGGTIDQPWRVTGTATEGATILNFEMPQCPAMGWGPAPLGPGVNFSPLTGEVTISGSTDTLFSNGTYFFRKLTKTGAGQMVIPSGDHVEVHVKETLSISEGGFNNVSGDSENLLLFGCSPNAAMIAAAPEWIFSATTPQSMVIYAPSHPLRWLSAGDYNGSITSKAIFLSSTGSVSYDSDLETAGEGTYALVSGSWVDLSP